MTKRDGVTEVRWEVDDGYSGKSRPQYTYIPNDEIDACETQDELNLLVDVYINHDFQQITWCFNGYPQLEEVKCV